MPGRLRSRIVTAWWRGHALVAVTGAAAVLLSLDPSMIAVANPRIADALHASISDTQWITSAFLLSFTILLVGGGTLADRFGRGRLLIAGMGCFCAGEVGAALASSVVVLVAARLLVGAGAAAAQPAAVSAFRAAFPAERTAHAMGVWTACAVAGTALAPLLTGWLLGFASWRAVFWVIAVLGLILTLVAAASLRGSQRGDPRVPLHAGASAVLTVGLGVVVWGLIRSGSDGWDATALVPVGCGVSALIAMALRGWSVKGAWPDDSPIAYPTIAGWLGVLTMASAGFIGTLFLIGIYVQRVLGASPLMAGLELLPFLAVSAVVAPACGRLGGRIGEWPMLVASLVLEVAGLTGLAQAGARSSYLAVWPFLVLIGLAFSAMTPAALNLLMRSAPPERGALLGALQGASNQLGGVLAVAVLGSVIAATVAQGFRAHLRAVGVHMRFPTAVVARLAQGVAPLPGGVHGREVTLVRMAGLEAFSRSMDAAFLIVAGAAGFALVLALVLRHSLSGRVVVYNQPVLDRGGYAVCNGGDDAVRGRSGRGPAAL